MKMSSHGHCWKHLTDSILKTPDMLFLYRAELMWSRLEVLVMAALCKADLTMIWPYLSILGLCCTELITLRCTNKNQSVMACMQICWAYEAGTLSVYVSKIPHMGIANGADLIATSRNCLFSEMLD